VPPNIERFINLYQSTNSLGGGAARPSRAFHGEYATVNLADRHEMTHITIDKMLALHHAIIPKFLEAVSFGSPPREAGVPIEYRVPQGARVEVWDSGIKAHAIAEDTPEAVAERYGVPTWVVAQLNKLVLDEPIGSGKDIVVPRICPDHGELAEDAGRQRRPGDQALKLQHAGLSVVAAERQHRAGGVPGERRRRDAARLVGDDLGTVFDPHQQHEAVLVAHRDHILGRMARDRDDAPVHRRQQARFLAHRAILAGERPQHELVGA